MKTHKIDGVVFSIPTNNPGTGVPPCDEKLKLLRSIDEKLGKLLDALQPPKYTNERQG